MINTMENKFCLVTSLFNIERERMNGNDGRSWDDYLKWFEKTLELKSSMVVFCEEDLVEFIKKRREIVTSTVSVLSSVLQARRSNRQYNFIKNNSLGEYYLTLS